MEEKTPESRRVDKALKKTQIPEEMAGTGRREKRYLMKIRHSAEQDFSRIMEIYSFARSFMAEHGNPNQWGPTGWPPGDLIHKDIREGGSYVCLNDEGTVIGTFFYTFGEDIEPTYRDITDGAWLDDSPYSVVHRIAGDGSEKGIGAFCISWAFGQCGHQIDHTPAERNRISAMGRKIRQSISMSYPYHFLIYPHILPETIVRIPVRMYNIFRYY